MTSYITSLTSAALLASSLLVGCTELDAEPRGPIVRKADVVTGSCSVDTCGGPAEDLTCYCDEVCVTYGDCCANHATTCEVEAEPSRICGGFAALRCAEDEYCHYDASLACGSGDRTGVCMPRPEACAEVFLPVCGCNGESFGNECEAHAAGVSVAADPALCGASGTP